MNKTTKISIDTEELRNWLDSRTETYRELALQIGKGQSYFSGVLKLGEMPEAVYNLFLRIFDLPEGSFKQKPKPVAEAPVKRAHFSDEPIIPGYEMTLQVRPSRIRVGLVYQGTEVQYQWAEIRGDKESDLLQAISYATHQMYKFAQLKYFGCSHVKQF